MPTPVDPQDLATALRVLEELATLEPDHPDQLRIKTA